MFDRYLNLLVRWISSTFTKVTSAFFCVLLLMCVLIDPETGRSKGFGFIQYKNANDAKQALEKMNGFELAGRNVGFFLSK